MTRVRIDLDGEGEMQREQVADERRHAERCRLPVEGQRHAQRLVGVPQRQLAMMHLRPRQRRPRDDLIGLVAGLKVVDDDTGLPQHAELGQDVVRTEGRAVGEYRSEDRQCRAPTSHATLATCNQLRTCPASAGRSRRRSRPPHLRWIPVNQARSLPAPSAAAGV